MRRLFPSGIFLILWMTVQRPSWSIRLMMLLNDTSNFNSLFGTDHPQLVGFVIILWDEADRIVQRLEDGEEPPEYLEPVFP